MRDAERNMRDEPVDIFAGGAEQPQLPPYRRASATGVYDHERAIFIGPRPLA